MLDLVKSELGKEEPAEACLEAENIRYVLIDEVQDYTLEQLNVIASYYCRARFLLLGDPNQAHSEGLASFDEIRELFAKHKGSVSEAHLAISYRSTVEITRLFASFADLNEHLRIESWNARITTPTEKHSHLRSRESLRVNTPQSQRLSSRFKQKNWSASS